MHSVQTEEVSIVAQPGPHSHSRARGTAENI